VLVFTYDEEVGTFGARQLAEQWPDAASLPRHCLIGEPTELKVVRAHKGFVSLRVTLRGKSAHSGYPHLGRNAIEVAARVLVSLRKLRHRLEVAGGPHAELFPEVPFVPLNVGTIHGGAAANVVPDLCVLELSARPLPGMNERGLLATIEQAVRDATGTDPVEVEVTATSPGLMLDPDAPIHTGLCGLTGQDAGLAVSYATDAGWLSRAGLECAILGPGSIEVAHRPNEYVPKQDLLDARRLLESAVGRFCR
jgi:acetylornithine deacetylase